MTITSDKVTFFINPPEGEILKSFNVLDQKIVFKTHLFCKNILLSLRKLRQLTYNTKTYIYIYIYIHTSLHSNKKNPQNAHQRHNKMKYY